MKKIIYQRHIIKDISVSLKKNDNLLNIIIGPRQVGKTTAANYILSRWKGEKHYANADLAIGNGPEWIIFQWNRARQGKGARLLVLDEIQKIPDWSRVVKGLWDEDRVSGTPVKALLLGSSSLLLTKGLSESLAGRFHLHRFTHWSYSECREAFGWNLSKWIYFGGYPGAVPFTKNIEEWKQYVSDSLIETVISRDVLALQTVTKPSLLRNLFTLAMHYPGQILSFNKMMGQLHDAGNTTTLSHYLKLLESAFIVSGLENYSKNMVRRKSSSPKLIVWNNALISSLNIYDYSGAKNDPVWRGRLVENAVGSHLMNNLQSIKYRIMYWRHKNFEVDFIISAGTGIWAIEVKSGRAGKVNGLHQFCSLYPNAIPIIIGSGGMDFESFFNFHPKDILI